VGPAQHTGEAIAPGVIKTRLSEALWKDPEVNKAAVAKIPLMRLENRKSWAGWWCFLAQRPAAMSQEKQSWLMADASMANRHTWEKSNIPVNRAAFRCHETVSPEPADFDKKLRDLVIFF
jgi:NAD(P)-dependent dehydrogenase (short-subunit alcohol dehydrogenase family)